MPYASRANASIAQYLLKTLKEKKPQTFLLTGMDDLRVLLSRLNLESDDQETLILIHLENDAIALHLRVDNDQVKVFVFDPQARGDAHGLTQQALEIIHSAHQQTRIQLSTTPVQGFDDAPLLCLQFLEYCSNALDDWNETQIISAFTQEKQQHITEQLQEMAQLPQADLEDAVLRMNGSNLPIRHFLMSASVMTLVSAHSELGERVEKELNDIINDAVPDINEVESDYKPGGFTQHQVQLALRATLAAKHKHVFIPDIEMLSGDKARLPYKEIQKQGYKHMAFAWQLTHSHQVAVWVTFNQDVCEVQVYDSKSNEGVSELTQNQFRSLLSLTETDPITLATPFYALQQDKWSCGAYAYATLSRLAGIQQPILLENVLDTHVISICLLTACAQEETHYIREREAKQENWDTLKQLLETIEVYRHQQGHYRVNESPLAASSSSSEPSSTASGSNPDFLSHLANFLQLIVWGNLDRQPSPNDQSNRALEYLECHFGISPLTLLQQYPDKNDRIVALVLQLAEVCPDVSQFPWATLFELVRRSQDELSTVESKYKPYKMSREAHNQKIAFDNAQMIAFEIPRSPERHWQMIDAILRFESDKMDEALTHIIRTTFEKDADDYIAGMYANGCYKLVNSACLEMLIWLSAQMCSHVADHQFIEEKRKRNEQKQAEREFQRWCHDSLERLGIQEEAERLTLMEEVTFSPGLRSRIALLPKSEIEILSAEGRQSLIRFALHAPPLPQQEFEFINQAILTLPLLEPVFYEVFNSWVEKLKEKQLINRATLASRNLIRLVQSNVIPVTFYSELTEPYNRWFTSLPVELLESLDVETRGKILNLIIMASRFKWDERHLIESALKQLSLRDPNCSNLFRQWLFNLNRQQLFLEWALLTREDVFLALLRNELSLDVCQSIHLRKKSYDIKFIKLYGELCRLGLLSDEGLNSLSEGIQANLLNENALCALREGLFSIEDLRALSPYTASQITSVEGLNALREGIFCIDEAKKIMTIVTFIVAENFFIPRGIEAMQKGYFDLDSIIHLPYQLLEILIEHGLELLFAGKIRLTQLRLLPNPLLHLLLHPAVLKNISDYKSTFAEIAHAVNDKLIPESAWHDLSDEALSVLLTSNGLKGLREKIFDAEVFKTLSVSQLTLLVTPGCMNELRQNLITWKDLSRLSDNLIERLTSYNVTRVNESGALHLHEIITIPEYILNKILGEEWILANLIDNKVTLSDLMRFYRYTDAPEFPDPCYAVVKKYFYTSACLKAYQNKLISSKTLKNLYSDGFEIILSDNGLYALENGILSDADLRHMEHVRLQAFVSSEGLYVLQHSPLSIAAFKSMPIDIARALLTWQGLKLMQMPGFSLLKFEEIIAKEKQRYVTVDRLIQCLLDCINNEDISFRRIHEMNADEMTALYRIFSAFNKDKYSENYIDRYFQESVTVLPSFANAMIARVLANDEQYRRLIKNAHCFRETVQLFPSHAEALIGRVLACDEELNTIDGYIWRQIIEMYPSHAETLISRVLASDEAFRRFIQTGHQLHETMKLFPSYAETLIARYLTSDVEFNINDAFYLREMIKMFPSHTEAFIAQVLASDKAFRRFIPTGYNLREAVELFPSHAEALFGRFLASDRKFTDNDRYSIREFIKLLPSHAEILIGRVFASDEEFRRLFNDEYNLEEMIKLLPSHADALRQRYAALPNPNPISSCEATLFFKGERTSSTSREKNNANSDLHSTLSRRFLGGIMGWH